MANPHNFKYNHIYRSPAGKLYIYKGSTCSSSKYGNSFQLTFQQIKPEPKTEGEASRAAYWGGFVTFPMFNCAAECNGWTLDKMATALFYKKDRLYFKNRT